MGKSSLFSRILLLAMTLAVMIAARSGMAASANYSDFKWTQDGDQQVFTIAFDRPPVVKAHDQLLEKQYFYVDFYGVSGTEEPADWSMTSPLVAHVRRVFYKEPGVMRFVFYTRSAVRFRSVMRSDGTSEIRVSPLTIRKLGATSGKPYTGPRKLIVIDPGHGGAPTDQYRSTGAASTVKVNGSYLEEKDLVLEIGKRLEQLVNQAPSLEATMTRRTDTYVSLEDRVKFAEDAGGDAFVSIHLNGTSRSSKTARGFEIYFLSDGTKEVDRELLALENDEQIDLHRTSTASEDLGALMRSLLGEKFQMLQEDSRDLAGCIDDEFSQKGPFRKYHRGVKSSRFRVLMNLKMPSVLLECGFLDNPTEARELNRPEVQDAIAAMIFNGLNRYFARMDPDFEPYQVAVSIP